MMNFSIPVVINVLFIFISVLIWLAIIVYLRLVKKRPWVYLFFFTFFFIYLYKVLDYTLFQFQSLLLLKQFMPNLMLRGDTAGNSINTIPLFTLTAEDIKTSLLNILLFIPFGCGLPFITNLRIKNVVVSGALLSMAIELLQLLTGVLGKVTFRVADINDLLFNTAGTFIGYILFVLIVQVTGKYIDTSRNPVLLYIKNRPQVIPLPK